MPMTGQASARHEVGLYDSEQDLVLAVVEFVERGVASGECAVVVATAAHRAAIESLLLEQGVDLSALLTCGAYRPLDAADTLACFSVADGLDEPLFEATIGGVLDDAASGGQSVRVFGEMVALLWGDGRALEAIELEEMWNRLAGRREFTLLCGYPTAAVEDHADLQVVNDVCRVHAQLIAPASYDAPPAVADAPSRVFVRSAAAVPAARYWVTATLAAWGESAVLEDAALVASELATNAVRHAESAFRASLSRTVRGIRLEFEDLAARRPSLSQPGLESHGGRGLALISALATDFGHRQTATGKVVWAELVASAA
jgi:anti-sigma regulatory factor (Ser/Thr protein kinase)